MQGSDPAGPYGSSGRLLKCSSPCLRLPIITRSSDRKWTMKISLHIEEWELTQPFRISGVVWVSARSLVVQVEQDGCVGWGEAQGVYYLDETAESMRAQVQALMPEIRRGLTREALQRLLPAGGARNAMDCALWDLECKKQGKTIWQLTGIEPRPVTTVWTFTPAFNCVCRPLRVVTRGAASRLTSSVSSSRLIKL